MILKDFLSQQTVDKTDLKHLVAGVLDITPGDLILHASKMLTDTELVTLNNAIERLVSGEPVYRILGWREFYGRQFYLNNATLEPRPDSETIIDAVKTDFPAESALSIIDLGTGTGCLPLTLLAEFPNATAVATDISVDALTCAQHNADNLDLGERISFVQDDMLNSNMDGTFDVIISNPPYIRSKDVLALDQHVQDFDPIDALDGGEDGLDFYRAIAAQYQKWLRPGGKLYLEIGHDQGKSVPALFKHTNVLKDLGGHDRVVVVSN
ncbi:MAG: peptide chain release factor N(5)-glutamine methyltransferase [Alphaproteobacteria bacterium]|nr:peptide chain release factor N(5)-glutamine methyltransferase [Alphaproteobacteria bacterium]MBN2779480.1 peptide chain release factor N(5)-glutamine methyltransferase [Alphaproteobacteria bacterium]